MSDYLQKIVEHLSKKTSKQIDDFIIEGLRRKGFEFENTFDLEQFIKERCTAADHQGVQQKTFYVDETPFLIWDYSFKLSTEYLENKTTITAEGGRIQFI